MALALAGAISPLLPPPGRAETAVIARAGAWSAFSGTANDGTRVCGASVAGDEERYLGIKHFAGNDYFVVQLVKSSWRIPARTRIPVRMAVDRAPAWNAAALGSNSTVEFRINLDALDEFINVVSAGAAMRVSFTEGSENDWNVSLRGSSAIMAAMLRCVRTFTAPTATPPLATPPSAGTKPVGRPGGPAAGGQPYAGGGADPYREPSASQPFAGQAGGQPFGGQAAPMRPPVQQAPAQPYADGMAGDGAPLPLKPGR
ncbi:hypothetical protein M0638_25355 [Roseomonas sp. NAR14]|uniref:Uncharacterized protein n=1 Tax=Roseomonas acroporae TaxID=2937791 RepID=A0A9X1YKK5_9PROT|nr:hypothetical protein [Roseomonas acroporae]MCK8787696.1 hypothetical protein [Roseomonas acroporae]